MKFLKALFAWLAQAALSLVLCCALMLLIWLEGAWYTIATWGAMPLAGLFLAYAAVRLGVNNYLAWIAPPLSAFWAHYIVTGYTPDRVAPTLLTALLSVVGAAAGFVAAESKHKKSGGHADGR